MTEDTQSYDNDHVVPGELRGSIQDAGRASDIAFGSPDDNPMAVSDRLLDKAVDDNGIESMVGGDRTS
jgi:hypothetical protein